MSATIAVPRRGRRRQIAMIAIAVAVAASLGVMLSLARGPDDPLRTVEPRLSNTPRPEPARPEPPATTAAVPAAPPAPTALAEPPAPTPGPPPAETAAPVRAAAAPPPDDDHRAVASKVVASPSRRTSAPARPAHPARIERAGAAQKQPIAGQKLATPCDPADDQHGTKCRRTPGSRSP